VSEYIVTRKSDNVDVYRYFADALIEWVDFPFATHDHTVAPPPPEPPPPPPPLPVLITKLAFRERFTQAEKITIELASIDVPDGQMASRQASAQMRVWLADIEAAKYIDLNYQPTRDGVQALEDYGLIAAGRAAEILDTAPADDEVWNG
jgi:hypothetical protein